MLTFRYSREFPMGKIFDTEGLQHEKPPSELNGWFDTPAKLHITQDQLIDTIVRQELAKQSADRPLIEKEVAKKRGRPAKVHFATKDETLIKILDDK